MQAIVRIALAFMLVLAADADDYDDPRSTDPTFGGYLQVTDATCAYVGTGARRWRMKLRAYCGVNSHPPASPFVLGQDGFGLRVGATDLPAIAPADRRLSIKGGVVRFRLRAVRAPRSPARIRAIDLSIATGTLTALVDFRGSIAALLSGGWSVPVTVTVGVNVVSTTVDFETSKHGRRWVRRPDSDKRVAVVVSGSTAVQGSEEFVLRDDAAWADVWRLHAAASPETVPPGVDFSRDMVVGVTGPQFGEPLWIQGVERLDDRVIVHVRHGITWDCAFGYLPWLGEFVRIPATTLPVEFDHRMRWINCLLPAPTKSDIRLR